MARPTRIIKLRPIRGGDIERLSSWLPDVASAVDCEPWTNAQALAEAKGSSSVLTNDAGTAFVAYQLETPDVHAARVDFLAVRPNQRRLGIGGRTALALERRLHKSTQRLCTLVPSPIGLALYFWLRLGYRPLTKETSPEPTGSLPAVWMVREL